MSSNIYDFELKSKIVPFSEDAQKDMQVEAPKVSQKSFLGNALSHATITELEKQLYANVHAYNTRKNPNADKLQDGAIQR
jgi:hypothetical protein